MERDREIGAFLRWGAAVSIDARRRLMTVLPESREEELVEIPNEDIPSEEALDIRCSWY